MSRTDPGPTDFLFRDGLPYRVHHMAMRFAYNFRENRGLCRRLDPRYGTLSRWRPMRGNHPNGPPERNTFSVTFDDGGGAVTRDRDELRAAIFPEGDPDPGPELPPTPAFADSPAFAAARAGMAARAEGAEAPPGAGAMFWILWSPEGTSPPTVKFHSRAAAGSEATRLVRGTGRRFHVMALAATADPDPGVCWTHPTGPGEGPS